MKTPRCIYTAGHDYASQCCRALGHAGPHAFAGKPQPEWPRCATCNHTDGAHQKDGCAVYFCSCVKFLEREVQP